MSELLQPGSKEANLPPQLRDRSPHPYSNLHRIDYESHTKTDQANSAASNEHSRASSVSESHDESGGHSVRRAAGTGSESGTEADDEKPHLLKALPPPAYRPRKGLKVKDGTASPLLTPSQLDQQGRRFSSGYFEDEKSRADAETARDAKLDEERRKFQAQRRAERIRRICEGALIGVIGLVVAHGSQLWTYNWPWYLAEILSQVLAIAGLVVFYPLRLVSVERQKGHLHIWSRFYIPPSFDPATVLYPTFLPALVSLSLLQQAPGLAIPNLVLGLASLPARLFPIWSWRSDINALHWAVSLAPLLTCKTLDYLAARFPVLEIFAAPRGCIDLPAENVVLLYPLHHSMLPIVDFLTTSSLLPSEKHLLSTALVNVLFFASSPQIVLLRSVLWIGGTGILILLSRVLHWNVLLARIPTWRLRRITKSKSRPRIRDALLDDLVSTLRSIFSRAGADSDGEDSSDDETMRHHIGRVPSLYIPRKPRAYDFVPQSAIEKVGNGTANGWNPSRRDSKDVFTLSHRRNTIATGDSHPPPFSPSVKPSTTHRTKSRRTDWVLRLNPEKVKIRKFAYAAFTYICVLTIGLLPMRLDFSKHALNGDEPITWALNYLFADVLSPQSLLSFFNKNGTSSILNALSNILATSPSIPSLRSTIGESTTRLLLLTYWLSVLALGLSLVFLLSANIEVDTRRKIFHGIMVTMLLPTIFVDPCFCALALILILAIFLLLEVIRAGQVAPLGSAIGRFVAPYVDGRDLRGPMVVSHVFLLIGCAIPVWLSLAAEAREDDIRKSRWPGWDLQEGVRQVSMVSGVVCVGMGDAAASLIGRRYGRRKWPWIGGKSLEGSAAFAFAVMIGLVAAKAWLTLGGWNDVNPGLVVERPLVGWPVFATKAIAAGCGASFMEAVLTGANDNVVVPIALWLLTRGLRL